MTYAVNLADVLALLRPEQVVAACNVDARERGRAWRLRTCPACGAHPSRQGAAIYRRRRDGSWRWTHHGHACGGDLLELIAAADGIDRTRDFPKLLARGAQLAGVTSSDPDLERRIAERRREDEHKRQCEDAERAAALAAMPGVWESLDRRSLVGERYLMGRGIDPSQLRAIGDVVRFTSSGELAVPMRDLDTGAISGIQYRAPSGKDFRMQPHSDPSCSALHGKIADLDPDGADVAVIVEGLADTLAALLAFPGCGIYGAAGASHVETIAEAVASRVFECRGWLLLCPDDDDVSAEHYADAIRTAKSAGLTLAPSDAGLGGVHTIRLVDLGEHHDLADAWRAGWRNTWPRRTT